MPHDFLSAWSLEAIEFFERLQAASLSEGFVGEFRPTQNEMAWFASLTLHGPLGQFELRLWTTPALAGLEQARLTLLPHDSEAIKALDETTMPVLQCEGIKEFGPLAEYLRVIVESINTKDRLLMGLRIGGDPRHRAMREKMVTDVRNMKAPLKPRGESS